MVGTVACQEIEVVKFLGSFQLCFFLSYVNQSIKSNLSKNYCQIWNTGFLKQKTNFLPPRSLFSLLLTKRVVLTVTLICLVIGKGQTYLKKPKAISCWLF